MDMNEFSRNMQQLLEMQRDYQRMKSENLLFRQQIDDLKKQNQQLNDVHQVELNKLMLGGISKIDLAETEIYKIINTLREWSDDLFHADWREMENSNSCSSSYYEEEKRKMYENSSQRNAMINQIEAILEKAAGLE